MDRILRCECGYEVSGCEAEVVRAAQAHAWDVHGMELSPQLARALTSSPDDAEAKERENDGIS